MAQIALPVRIALVAVLVLGALWATVLRPKGDDTAAAPAPAATAPGVDGLTKAVDQAKGAAAASDAANARLDAATGGSDAAATASGKASAHAGRRVAAKAKGSAVEGVDPGDPSAPLVRALGEGKVAVLLFAGDRAVDDRAARRAVRAVGRRDGNVSVKLAAPRSVGRYEAITRGVKVSQFPTVLVIGPDKVAKPITGFTTAGEVDQMVGDAVATAAPTRDVIAGRDAARAHARRTCGSGADGAACRTYFANANDVCVTAAADAAQAGVQAVTSGGGGQAVVAGIESAMSQTVAQFAAQTPPAAQKAGHARALALLRADDAQLRKLVARTRGASDPVAALDRAVRRDERTRASRRDKATMTRLGYAACAA